MYTYGHPQRFEAQEYDRARQHMTDVLSGNPSVVSVYGMGSVTAPGISDIDMIAVLKNETACHEEPRKVLDVRERYLFVHRLYACPERMMTEAIDLNAFDNICHLAGKDLQLKPVSDSSHEGLEKQITLEYLLRMYITSEIETTHRTMNIRSLLLHVKGVVKDLALLDEDRSSAGEIASEIFDMRNRWFTDVKGNEKKLVKLYQRFVPEFRKCIAKIFGREKFYLPSDGPFKLSERVFLERGTQVSFMRKGFRLPPALEVVAGKYFAKIQHRLGSFRFTCPASVNGIDPLIQRRFEFTSAAIAYNEKYAPDFYPLASSLRI